MLFEASRVRISLLVFSLLSLSCEESLPPRVEPQRFLQASIGAIEGIVAFRSGTATSFTGGFILQIRNVFDEVLQGNERVNGDIDVWLKDDPARRAVVHADSRDMTNIYLISGKVITLGPDTAATMIKQWDHQTDDGVPFWTLVPLTERINSFGEHYRESDPVRFVARANIQVFENVQPVRTDQIEFSFVYYIFE